MFLENMFVSSARGSSRLHYVTIGSVLDATRVLLQCSKGKLLTTQLDLCHSVTFHIYACINSSRGATKICLGIYVLMPLVFSIVVHITFIKPYI